MRGNKRYDEGREKENIHLSFLTPQRITHTHTHTQNQHQQFMFTIIKHPSLNPIKRVPQTNYITNGRSSTEVLFLQLKPQDVCLVAKLQTNQQSSVNKMTGYELRVRGLFPGRGKRAFL